ncbi:MAG: ATP-dependent DNA helicase RecG, partial [Atopobiaceae bacterium]|nr:ATP-dependent DNA helicase RecG [Atopobiaceae bacterium]
MGSTPAIGEAQDRLARTLALSEDVTRLRYAKRFLEPLERLGLARVRDVLLHVPHRYLDFTNLVPVSHADVGREATVVVTVDEVRSKRPRPRLSVVELACTDGTGVIMASF